MFLPKVNLKSIMNSIEKAVEGREAYKDNSRRRHKERVLDRDVEEFNEFYDFIKHIKAKELGMVLILRATTTTSSTGSRTPQPEVHRQEALIGTSLLPRRGTADKSEDC